MAGRVRHEPAPALQALMLDWMKANRWEGDGKPRLLFLYTDRVSEVELPSFALADHPRVMVKRMADLYEECRRDGRLVAKPADLIGVGMVLEFWDISFKTPEERDYWRTRNFADHPQAIETRMMIVHQPGHPPVAALHNRDRRGTQREFDYRVPTITDEPMVPGGAAPPLLIHLERLCRALLAAPATFLSGR